MIQCTDCEFFERDEKTGRIMLHCDPFRTIKEPACLDKMQLLRLDGLLQSYHAMLRFYQQMAPMQKKMFDMMQREIDDYEDGEAWKYNQEEDDTEDDFTDEDSER